MSDAAMVRVRDLRRTYGSGPAAVHALRHAFLDVPRGAIVALTGRSGSGKTTLLNLIGGLDRPTAGTIEVDGVDLVAMSDRARTALRRQRIAFVFQTFGLLPTLSAAENVGLPLRLARTPVREREARVAELLERVGLRDLATLRPAELSGGQQQRVAVARALAPRPRLLIADEPTGRLDAATGTTVLALLTEAVRAEGATAVLSTHDIRVAETADLRLTIEDGVLDGPGSTVVP